MLTQSPIHIQNKILTQIPISILNKMLTQSPIYIPQKISCKHRGGFPIYFFTVQLLPQSCGSFLVCFLCQQNCERPGVRSLKKLGARYNRRRKVRDMAVLRYRFVEKDKYKQVCLMIDYPDPDWNTYLTLMANSLLLLSSLTTD